MLESLFPLSLAADTRVGDGFDVLFAVEAQLPRFGVGGTDRLDFKFMPASATDDQPDQQREVSFRWRVMSSHGNPAEDALAYRFEALVLRRRVEAEQQRVVTLPSKIYLGTVERIAAKLETNPAAINRAVEQSFLRCVGYTINWTDAVTGNKRDLDNLSGRRGFSSDAGDLQDGTRMTNLWLDVSDVLRRECASLPPRPFDYEFAQRLTPATLRAYEVLSYHIFDAIKRGRREVRIPYPMYCLLTANKPRTRRQKARAHIRQLHQPLIENQTLEAVELVSESVTESAPLNDISIEREWQLRFPIGEKAVADFGRFLHESENPSAEVDEQNALAEFYAQMEATSLCETEVSW